MQGFPEPTTKTRNLLKAIIAGIIGMFKAGQKMTVSIFSTRARKITAFGILAVAFISLALYAILTRQDPTIRTELAKIPAIGEKVMQDLQAMPSLALAKTDQGYQATDDLKDEGIKIENNVPDGLTIQDNTASTVPKQEIAVNFPKDYQKPLEIKLDEQRTILITDNSTEKFSSQALANEIPKPERGSASLSPEARPQVPRYLKYSSGRKSIYYSFQKDTALGERKLKNWLIYEKGTGQEQESYTFQNARLELDEQGQVKVYFDNGQEEKNQQAMAEVEPSLMERARRAILKDTGQDITNNNQPPDLIIPQAYYIDKNGEQTTIDWTIENKNTLKLQFQVDKSQYPIALDPTLQFTAPGTNTGVDVVTGEGINSYFGSVLAAADLNADGRTDLAVGAYGYNSNQGRIYIFYNEGNYTAAAAAADVVITGEAINNYFGASLAAGDLNADGKTDLAVGAYGYNSSQGRTYIFLNDGSYPATAGSADTIMTGEGSNNEFGYALATGDFDASGSQDLALGARRYNSYQGRIYFFYNDGSYPTVAALADATTTGESTNSYFGSSLAAGDLNADGRVDLAAGAYNYNNNATGRAYILYNDGSYPSLASTSDAIITGEATNNNFGYSLAAGDFNSDGKTDLAVGANRYSNNYTGRAYIFYNDGSYTSLASTSDAMITGEATNNYFASSLAAGDFNADGRTDLAIGAYNYNNNGTGRAYVFLDTFSGSSFASAASVIISGETTNNYFGAGFAIGDFNSDGENDLVVGASRYNSYQGRVYIFSSQNGMVNMNRGILGEDSNGYFGESLEVADFDGDVDQDLAVGIYSNRGKVYIFYNEGDYPSQAASADEIISGETERVQYNNFGVYLVAGDFNYDSKVDLAVTGTGSSYTNNVYIFYNDGSFPNSAENADMIIESESVDLYLCDLKSGDMNSDGKTDLVVGSFIFNESRGYTHIFYNDGSYPSSTAGADVEIYYEASGYWYSYGEIEIAELSGDTALDLAIYGHDMHKVFIIYNDGSYPTNAADADAIITGESSGYAFGRSMASGDLNSDGKTDLVVGDITAGTSSEGMAYIFFNDGLYPSDAGSADIIISGAGLGNGFGNNISTAKLDAGSTTDLIVSSDQSSVYIFLNDGSYPLDAESADFLISGNDLFGQSLACGDVDGDTTIDLVVGADMYNNNQGRVHIFSNDGAYPSSANDADDIIVGEEKSESFGKPLSIGDFDADGDEDLAVSATPYNNYQGRVYLFWNDGVYPASAETPDVVIQGEGTGDQFGSSMSAGDFNADGKTDLAVGAKNYNSGDGRVYIFYNDSLYPAGAGSADVIITSESASSSYFGKLMISGDFNADGKLDLTVSGYDSSRGRVYIFYNDGSYPANADSADVIITAQNTNSHFGNSFGQGDVNSDGKIDLLVGDLQSPISRLFVFYNDGSYPSSDVSAEVIITGQDNNFSSQIVAGDFNADGRTDIAASDPYYDPSYGRVYIFYNDGSYSTAAASADVIINGQVGENRFGICLGSADLNLDGREDLISSQGGPTSSDPSGIYIFYNDGSYPSNTTAADLKIKGVYGEGGYLGDKFLAGDLDADGKQDLVISADNYNSYPAQGKVYLYSGQSKYATTLQRTPDAVRITGATGEELKTSGEEGAGEFSYALAAGDYNNDSGVDLAVGAPGYNLSQGRIYVFYSDGSIPVSAASPDRVIDGPSGPSRFGAALSAGDFSRDGRIDLAVGAPGANSNSGLVYIFHYGIGNYPASASSAPAIIFGETGSGFGSSLSAGRFNADAYDDLLVGAPAYSAGQGRVYLFNTDGSLPTTAAAADRIITGEAGSGFGYGLSAAYLSSGTSSDIIVTAPYHASNTGRAYLFYPSSGYQSSASLANVIITSSGSSSLGASLAIGDFDHDGEDDLALGATSTDSGTGAAYIFLNDASLATTTADADITVSGQSGSSFGASLEAGDFDQNGRDDLAAGAPAYDSNTGRAYIILNDGSFPSLASSSDIVITGENTGDHYGYSLEGADLNRDGITDLVAGAKNYNSGQGRMYIYTLNDSSVSGIGAEELGYSLLPGDFNADGKIDLAAGAPGYNSNQGRVYLFYARDLIAVSSSSADLTFTGEASSRFGSSLSAASFDSDADTDLAIGAPSYSSGQGRVYIFLNDGSYGNIATSADTIIDGDAGSDFGFTLATGLFNQDVKTDLIVGAPGYDSDRGRAYLYYNDGAIGTTTSLADHSITGEASSGFGKAVITGYFNYSGGTTTDILVGAPDYNTNTGRAYLFYSAAGLATTTADAGLTLTGENTNNYFGRSLASADLNLDGKTDLAIGAYGYNSSQGRVYIFYQDASYPQPSAADRIITGEEISSEFGFSLATGDLNADGKADLAAGSPGYQASHGKIYIFYQKTSAVAQAAQADKTMVGDPVSDFGSFIAIGDFNANSIPDIAIGSPGYASGQGKFNIIITETRKEPTPDLSNPDQPAPHVQLKNSVQFRGSVQFR